MFFPRLSYVFLDGSFEAGAPTRGEMLHCSRSTAQAAEPWESWTRLMMSGLGVIF